MEDFLIRLRKRTNSTLRRIGMCEMPGFNDTSMNQGKLKYLPLKIIGIVNSNDYCRILIFYSMHRMKWPDVIVYSIRVSVDKTSNVDVECFQN